MQTDLIFDIARKQANWLELDGKLDAFDFKTGKIIVNDQEMVVENIAKSQFINRLKLNGTYSELWDAPDILQMAIDRRIGDIAENNRRRDTRLIFDPEKMRVKAIKTTAYQRVHNLDILEHMTKKGAKIDERYSFIDDAGMSIIMAKGERTLETKIGDTFRLATEIKNSEMGWKHASLSVKSFYERLKCMNGATIKTDIGNFIMSHIPTDIYDQLHTALDMVPQMDFPQMVARNMARPVLVNDRQEFDDHLALYRITGKHLDPIWDSQFKDDFNMPDLKMNNWGLYNMVTYYTSHSLTENWARDELNMYAANMLVM